MAVKTTVLLPDITLNLPLIKLEIKLREKKIRVTINSLF